MYLLKTQDTFGVAAESGTRYQIEIQVFWDDEEKKNLRVIDSIDDSGIRAFFPMTDDFIITRDGDFSAKNTDSKPNPKACRRTHKRPRFLIKAPVGMVRDA